MEKLKIIFSKLLFPHISIVILLVPIATVLLIYAFVSPDANNVVVYASYGISAYALTVLCARIPELYIKTKSIKENNKYISRYAADVHLRIRISLYVSLTLNTLYALMQLVSGLYYHSIWFYALAGYYILLVIIRFFLLRDTLRSEPGNNRKKELYRYRFCGILLLIMNLTLAVIVFYIVRQNRGFEYHYIHTIAMAAYTFAATGKAIVNIFKYRRYESPVMSAAKTISLVSAVVSILSLETAMLSAFGEQNAPYFRQIMTALTGAAVCVFILVMAVYMIVWSNREIKKYKGASKNGEKK